MLDSLIKVTGASEVAQALERLPRNLVVDAFLDSAAAFNEIIYDALLAVTPEQDANESGGAFNDPGSLRESLDSYIELDAGAKGVKSGVGYGKQARIAQLVDRGHRLVRNGKVVGAAAPHPFIRQTLDGPAVEKAIGAFADTLEKRLEF